MLHVPRLPRRRQRVLPALGLDLYVKGADGAADQRGLAYVACLRKFLDDYVIESHGVSVPLRRTKVRVLEGLLPVCYQDAPKERETPRKNAALGEWAILTRTTAAYRSQPNAR